MDAKGVSLFEILIVIVLIFVTTLVLIPSYRGFGVKNNLVVAVNALAQSLNQAQILARAGDQDSAWGVKIQPRRITIFKGTNFNVRDASFDKVVSISDSIVPSGLTELYFAKLSGVPQPTGTFTLTNVSNGEIANVSINAQGTVSY